MQPVSAKRSAGVASRGRKTRVLVADDHPLIRDGLKTVLEGQPDLEVVGQARDGEEAIRLAQKLRPDVTVMDMFMPRMDGLMATERLRSLCPEMAIVILSGFSDEKRITEALRLGALGYVSKLAVHDEILRAIRCVAEGRVYLERSMAEEAFRLAPPSEPPPGALASREVEILKLSASGYGNKEIADMLDLSVKAVESSKARSMAALGLPARHALVRYALDKGWLTPCSVEKRDSP